MFGIRSASALFLAAAIIASFPTSAAAQESLVVNDSVGETFNGMTATAQLVPGEGYEAVFDIPADWIGPFGLEILGVRVAVFEGANPNANYCARFHVDVYEEPMGPAVTTSCPAGAIIAPAPNKKDAGTPIYSMTSDPSVSNIGFEVQGQPRMTQASFTDLRYSAITNNPNLNVTLNPVITTVSRVRVRVTPIDTACQIPGDEPPVILSDADGVSAPLQNFLFGYYEDFDSSTFAMFRCGDYSFVWEEFGKTIAFQNSNPGDWVMRLIVAHDEGSTGMVDMGGTGMDAGMDAGIDMGGTGMDAAMDMGLGGEDFGMAGGDMGSGVDSGGTPDTGSASDTGNNTADGLGIMSITPDSGFNDESNDVIILGSGFEPGAEVLIGAENIGVTSTDNGRIRATVPEGFNPGQYDVIVSNPGGDSVILSDGFEVLARDAGGSGGSASGADGGCGCASSGGSVPGALLVLVAGFFFARVRRRR